MSTTTIHIAHKVLGSLTTQQGDTVLSFTPGVSNAAQQLAMLSAAGAPAGHASFYVLPHARAGMLHLIHVQGDHTIFANGIRKYATRAVYECPLEETDRIGGYTPVVDALGAMRHYDTTDYNATDMHEVKVARKLRLNADELTLHAYIAYALTHGCRIFIHLGSDEQHYADELRQSARLEALLHAIDHLPPLWRHLTSMAFAVVSSCQAAQALEPTIVAHLDDTAMWQGTPNALFIDWTGDHPHWAGNQPDVAPCNEELQHIATNDPTQEHTTDKTPDTPRPRTWLRWTVAALAAAAAAAAAYICNM